MDKYNRGFDLALTCTGRYGSMEQAVTLNRGGKRMTSVGLEVSIKQPVSFIVSEPDRFLKILASFVLSIAIYVLLLGKNSLAAGMSVGMLVPGIYQLVILRIKDRRVKVLLLPFVGLLVRPCDTVPAIEYFESALIGPLISLSLSGFCFVNFGLTNSQGMFSFSLAFLCAATLNMLPIRPLPGGVMLSLCVKRAKILQLIFLGLLATTTVLLENWFLVAVSAALCWGLFDDNGEQPPFSDPEARRSRLLVYLIVAVFTLVIFFIPFYLKF